MLAAAFAMLPLAVAETLNYEGYLTSPDGTPLNGEAAIETGIYDAEIAGTLVWQESHPVVTINDGIFAIDLGATTAFPDDLFASTTLWLEIAINGEILVPRQRLTGYPFAARSQVTEGLVDDAIETQAIADGVLTPDKLAEVCAEGEVLVMQPSGWACGPGPCVPRPETCDGFDNDCDGVVDNDVCTTRQGR